MHSYNVIIFLKVLITNTVPQNPTCTCIVESRNYAPPPFVHASAIALGKSGEEAYSQDPYISA